MERALARSRDRFQDPRLSRRRIRLMIVDDSTVARAVLSRMIETDPAFEICAVAGTAEEAIDALDQVRVDIVILDLEMPGAGGLKSIPRIIAAGGGAKVMIVSSLAEEGAEQTVAALALGPADTLPKPGTGRFNGRFSEILVGKLKALGYAAAPVPEPAPAAKPGSPALLRAMPADPIDVLAVGASTGGIHALGVLFGGLPKRIGVPILKDLPVLGALFSSTRFQRNETELLVVVTPVVVDAMRPRTGSIVRLPPDSLLPARGALDRRPASDSPAGRRRWWWPW